MDQPKVVKAVLFDFDDTLVHLPVDWSPLKTRFRKEFGFSEDQGMIAMLKAAEPDVFNKMNSVLGKVEEEAVAKAEISEDTIRTLKVLKENGIKLGVITHNTNQGLEAFQKRVGIQFDVIMTRQSKLYKPDPRIMEIALDKIGVSKEDAVFVGNSNTDMELGVNSGVFVIGINGQNLKQAGANLIVAKLSEILPI